MIRAPDQLAALRLSLTVARLAAVPLAALFVGREDFFPAGYEKWAWLVVGVLAIEAIVLFVLGRRRDERPRTWLDLVALGADVAIVFALLFVFAFEPGRPLHPLVFFLVVEGALRFGRRGGLAVALVTAPLLAGVELFRSERFDYVFREGDVLIRLAVVLLTGAIVGRLTEGLLAESRRSARRAEEAERLRDELGRRVDVLEAANRAARALGSSLELDQAFGVFIRELGGLVAFDRMAIVLAEDGRARVMATAGEGADAVFPPGSARAVEGSVLEQALAGQIVYREDMSDRRYDEEDELVALGLHCRLVAPLLLGARSIGIISLVRREPGSFSPEEIELVSLLGRLVATAVQNIRAYEAERNTVEELRRLSALRADFVSLVSHELRSPMAAVVGSARTLQQRWRELAPEQRQSFLELIAGETDRLAVLIGDVLDTSRIEAGTFSYSFSDVDLAALVRDTVATAELGQDEVPVVARVREPVPAVRGDRDRLRQVVMNLLDNAVKYSPAGEEVRVEVYAHEARVFVDVVDRGPGVPTEQQRLIFEKFGRAKGDGGGKPGTGLGLFIARSIAEAHGGTLEVRSAPRRGSTFSLVLPVG